MIAIVNIFFQGFINEVLQLFIKTHSCKSTNSSRFERDFTLCSKKPRYVLNVTGLQEYFLKILFNRLKPDILYYFFSVLRFHKNIGAEFSGIGLQGAYAIMPAGGISFVFQVKSFHTIIAEKIFYNKLCLGLAVIITFVGYGQF